MKNLLLSLVCMVAVTAARADFTSYTLVSQSDPLTYDPVVSFTFDTLSINFTGNSGGAANFTTDFGTGAVVTLHFTSTASIVGDSVQLAWIYPSDGTVFEYFPSIIVPGTVDLGFGASDFTVSSDTISITNTTEGWTGAQFNGFVLTDLTRKAEGPSGTVPDAASTLLLIGGAFAAMVFCGRKLALVRA